MCKHTHVVHTGIAILDPHTHTHTHTLCTQASLYSNGVLILCLPGWIVCISQDRNKDTYRPGVREAREVFSVFQLPADSLGQPVHVWQVAELQSVMRWGDPSLLARDTRLRYVCMYVCSMYV